MGAIVELSLGRIAAAVVNRAAKIVREGGVILYPTDTIYGLGCDATNARAIERTFEVKRRPETKPVLVLVHKRSMVRDLAEEISPLARMMMQRFWPGPLTLLFPARPTVHPLLTGSEGKIGIRLPNHRFCTRLVAAIGRPLVSTSANISGEPVKNSITDLKSQFADTVDLVMDSGDLPLSPPSTIVDVTGMTPIVVREGSIPTEEILQITV